MIIYNSMSCIILQCSRLMILSVHCFTHNINAFHFLIEDSALRSSPLREPAWRHVRTIIIFFECFICGKEKTHMPFVYTLGNIIYPFVNTYIEHGRMCRFYVHVYTHIHIHVHVHVVQCAAPA